MLDQRLLHGGAGGVGHVHDAPGAVAALAGEVQVSIFFREGHAQRTQPVHAFGRMLHHKAGGRRVGQAGTGHQGVLNMGVKAVALGQHGGNPALGPGTGAIAHAALGEHGHAVRGSQMQCGGQARQAAAHDQDIKSVLCDGGDWRHSVAIFFIAGGAVLTGASGQFYASLPG